MKRMTVSVMALAMLAGVCWGRPLTVQEKAQWAATEVIEFSYSDLTNATAGGTQTVTTAMSVFSNDYVECVAAVLVTPWTVASTDHTDACTMEVGDGGDSDLYLASMELASDGTEVRVKAGRGVEASLTGTTRTFTNVIYEAGGVTGNVSTVTYTVTNTRYGAKLYTADDTVDFKFAADADQALGDFTAGKVMIFFRVSRPGDWY